LVPPTTLKQAFAPLLVLQIQFGHVGHDQRIIGRNDALISLSRAFARLIWVPRCLPVGVPRIADLCQFGHGSGEFEFLSVVKVFAGERLLGAHNRPCSKIFVEPFEGFDASRFAGAAWFRLVFTSAFVVYNQRGWAKHRSSVDGIRRDPVADDDVVHCGFRTLGRHVEPKRCHDGQWGVCFGHYQIRICQNVDWFPFMSYALINEPPVEVAVIVVVRDLNGTTTEITSFEMRSRLAGCAGIKVFVVGDFVAISASGGGRRRRAASDRHY